MRFSIVLLTFLAVSWPQLASSEVTSVTDKIVNKFMSLDLDENESVSLEEYQTMVLERMNERFTQMDSDGDGEVTEEEYRTFWVEQKSQYYRPRR